MYITFNKQVLSWCLFLFFGILQGQNLKRLPNEINSSYQEYAPSISADGKTMIYQSNKDGQYKLYVATLNGSGQWKSSPIDAINDYGDSTHLIAGSSLSYDGNFIYFFAGFDGGYGKEDIWYVEKEGAGWSDPVNLGPAVNSPGYEGFPSISSDGKTLYFMRSIRNQLYKGKFCYRLWKSERDHDGNWMKAVQLPKPINGGCENCPRIMSDNETLIFAAIRGIPTSSSNYDIYQSKYLGQNQWSDPVPLDFMNSSADDLYGTIPSKGDLMYFNKTDGQQYDLFTIDVPQAVRPKTVVNIQGKVTENGGDQPIAASLYVMQESDTINYGNVRSNGYDGNFTLVLPVGEIYQVTAVADGFESKTETFDLSNQTEYEVIERSITMKRFVADVELNFLNEVDGQTLIPDDLSINGAKANLSPRPMTYETVYRFESKKEGFHTFKDSIILSGQNIRNQTFTYKLRPEDLILEVSIISDETNEVIPGYFLLYDSKDRKKTFEGPLKEGTYKKKVGYNRLYKYKAIAKEHFYTQGEIDLRGICSGQKVVEELHLTPLKVGSKLTLNNINFDFGSSELTDDAKQELANVLSVLAQNRSVIMEISAHTDDVGTVKDNQLLSEQRAQAVMDYLVSKKVPSAMLSSKGYGETSPMVANTSGKNRALNRRVEFLVKGFR